MLRAFEALLVVGVFVFAWLVSPWLVGALGCVGGLMLVDRVEKGRR